MKKIFLLLLVSLWACSLPEKPILRLGVDPSWPMIEAGLLGRNLNGFLEEFLLEICAEEKIRIELVKVNRTKLIAGLEAGHYEAILSTLYPYDFNRAKYAFSQPLLLTGSVLIAPKTSPKLKLEDLSGKLVGVVREMDTNFLIQRYPEVVYKEYSSTPELLNQLEAGFLDGAIVENLQAIPFVKNLFANRLVVTGPLSDMGIRLVCLKEKKSLLKLFKKHLKDEKRLNVLKAKWELF